MLYVAHQSGTCIMYAPLITRLKLFRSYCLNSVQRTWNSTLLWLSHKWSLISWNTLLHRIMDGEQLEFHLIVTKTEKLVSQPLWSTLYLNLWKTCRETIWLRYLPLRHWRSQIEATRGWSFFSPIQPIRRLLPWNCLERRSNKRISPVFQASETLV